MGNPLGPTLANAFLCHHEIKWLDNCPSDFKPIFYRRYVDDTFILFRDPSHVAKFLDYLNSQHGCIKFTVDIENNNQLNFLDVKITKTENSFQTSVFRKSTFSGLGLQFDSSIPHHFRTNIISCLIDRAFKICSTELAFNFELKILKQFFLTLAILHLIIISKFDLKILESIYIHKIKPSLNDHASSVELSILK